MSPQKKLKGTKGIGASCVAPSLLPFFLSLTAYRLPLTTMSQVELRSVTVTRPTFTAAYAHKRAARSAAHLCQTAKQISCGSCRGTGTMTFTMSTITAEGETPQTQQSIPCIHCKDGKVSKVKQLYERLVWCQCRQRVTSGFLKAADGHRIFGNTTYLCDACGFVKQFG